METYFNDPSFPNNMPQIWWEQWGYLSSSKYSLVIGEFGGKEAEGSLDRIWSDEIENWFIQNNITNNFFWSLNPNSKDTGGIFYDDWSTPNTYKLDILNKINPSPTKFCKINKDTQSIIISQPTITPISKPLTPTPDASKGLLINKELRNTWTIDSTVYNLYNLNMTNILSSSISEIILQCFNCTISQYWGINFNNITSVFSLPDWIKYTKLAFAGNTTINFGTISCNSTLNLNLVHVF
jgi:hypothetical protein